VQVTLDGGRSVVTPSGATVLPAAVSTAWIAPDASAAVLVDRASVASLVQIDSDQTGEAVAAEPVELGDVDGLVAFLDR
jgi:hypothetical protein